MEKHVMKIDNKEIETLQDMPIGPKLMLLNKQFGKEPVAVRSLGNYGVGEKVYLCDFESDETPESMANKFGNDILPFCFVCWDFQIGDQYKITIAG
jgi:hypothetical protein